MEVKLTKIGNSQGVILNTTVLDLAGANKDTSFKLEIKDGQIILTPIK